VRRVVSAAEPCSLFGPASGAETLEGARSTKGFPGLLSQIKVFVALPPKPPRGMPRSKAERGGGENHNIANFREEQAVGKHNHLVAYDDFEGLPR
jgi:hypothetical protein